ncbi:hypothetical protein MPTK1_6g12430 [Marchantia polymorpha subsp. ruderalis]|uniref:Uncharacterized protein n=2 Tax=Marchantia polymorpha TaxID=3197 RepID=A0AAF6BR82_MARPO|nr:hypothetical protein MARPO_0059s0103 [Marchantia polymorpha]BBN14516.1 hypothetical protein Mp_6g12430 [Marchantia polymorpha subsp. ruderalis]|eukprot:PTQ37203.1 hypothetical protein MARPO_0059s0103 [Marchantia polymorpha]
MDEHIQALVGSRVTSIEATEQLDGRTLVQLHLFKEGSRTVLTLEEVSYIPSCRWIENRLLVLGHMASLMQEVLKSDVVELSLLSAEGLFGRYRKTKSGRIQEWIAFTNIILRWKDYKVTFGDVECDELLTSGDWPAHIPFCEGHNADI